MSHFTFREGRLYAENVAVSDIAESHGTPCYVYSRAALEAAFTEYLQALEDTGNNQQLAATKLGISARTIRNKLKKYREEGLLE